MQNHPDSLASILASVPFLTAEPAFSGGKEEGPQADDSPHFELFEIGETPAAMDRSPFWR